MSKTIYVGAIAPDGIRHVARPIFGKIGFGTARCDHTLQLAWLEPIKMRGRIEEAICQRGGCQKALKAR